MRLRGSNAPHPLGRDLTRARRGGRRRGSGVDERDRPGRNVDEVQDWICELRGRLERGELAGVPPVRLMEATRPMPAELAANVILATVYESDDLPPDRLRDPDVLARRSFLLRCLLRLREQIG